MCGREGDAVERESAGEILSKAKDLLLGIACCPLGRRASVPRQDREAVLTVCKPLAHLQGCADLQVGVSGAKELANLIAGPEGESVCIQTTFRLHYPNR